MPLRGTPVFVSVEVYAGCEEVLPPSHLAASPIRDLSALASAYHNNLLYVFRQVHFANGLAWRDSSLSEKGRAPLQPYPIYSEYARIGEGLLRYDGRRLVEVSGEKSYLHGMLGSLANTVVREFNQQIAAYWKSVKSHRASPGSGSRPSPPRYNRTGVRALAWKCHQGGKWQQVTPDPTYTQVTISTPRAATPIVVPSLTIPLPLRERLRSGEAVLVELKATPLQNGSVRLHWLVKESGRAGIPFPDAPTSLAKAAMLSPVASLDFGMKNLAALAYTDLRPMDEGRVLPVPVLVRGSLLLAHEEKIRMQVRRHQMLLPKKGGRQQRSSRALQQLWSRHRGQRRHLVHLAVKPILESLDSSGARVLVVGWNKGIKQELDLGRRTNRRFTAVPYAFLRQVLAWECKRRGTLYMEVEEGYTSKTSYADGESPSRQESYAGRRTSRGLFMAGTGIRVNADVNGALQIGVKALEMEGLAHSVTDAVREATMRRALNPRSITLSCT